MFIIELTYKKPLEIVDQYLEEHRSFLDDCYANQFFIASGPKNPRNGGIILSTLTDREHLEQLLNLDPFKINDIAEFGIIEFTPSKYHSNFMKLILQNQLQSLLKSLIKLLELHNENNWRQGFINTLNRMDDDNLGDIARDIRKCYAGMGSFNDLVLHKNHKPLIEENNQLDELRQSIYKMTWDIASFNARRT